MAQINLKGMGVALITPFKDDESIDFDALSKLIEYQIQNGIDYLVVLGTTAETPTFTRLFFDRFPKFFRKTLENSYVTRHIFLL